VLHSEAKANSSGDSFGKYAESRLKQDPDALKINIFSKHLQWLNCNEMAKIAAEMGFDGIDLTVRPQGHVLPERVEEDLPKTMEAVKKTGKEINMITTSITDADDPLSEKILKTASSLGIRHYRTGYFFYDDAKTIEENISIIQLKLNNLAKLNEKYTISGEYQNHSGISGNGIYFGAAMWDLNSALKDINSKYLGSQFDIYHATVEGANTWQLGLKLLSPYIRSMDVKDVQWSKVNGKWSSLAVPLGKGMIDYKKYLTLLKQFRIKGPFSIHYEYPLGGAENGSTALTMKKEDVISAMKKDLVTFKKLLCEIDMV